MSILAGPSAAQAGLSPAERSAVRRINHLRADHGLRPVRADRRLSRAADAHSADMLAAGFFDHPSSDGESTYDRVQSYRRSNLIGETLGFLPVLGNTSPAAVVRMWIQSPSHFAVMTRPEFRRIGIAKRRGTLFGQQATVWTADFASRR